MRAFAAGLTLLLALPAAATAAVARVEDGRLHYIAGPAEANRVTLEVSSGRITLLDIGAEVEAQAGCTAVDPQRVTCTASSVWAELGDGEDSIESPPEADTLDGGEGVDTLSYERRRDPLLIDLADPGLDGHRRDDGVSAAAEDTTAGFENLVGGAGQDGLSGTAADNVIDAGDGATRRLPDSLWGRAGNDTLLAGPRGSNLSGGLGDDVLVGGAGADAFSCGKGREDLVESVTVRDDSVAGGCEWLRDRRLVLDPIARPAGASTLRYVLRCPAACQGTLTLRLQGEPRLLGRGTFGGARRVSVRVPLNRRARALRRTNGSPLVDAFLRAEGVPDAAWSARLP